MEWFNGYGLALMCLLLLPNGIFALSRRGRMERQIQSRGLEWAEQTGRFACLGLMSVNLPGVCRGFWFAGAGAVYYWQGGILTGLYCLIWILCWNREGLFRSLALSILPTLLFLSSGILLGYPLLAMAAVLFGAAHITISYRNAVK